MRSSYQTSRNLQSKASFSTGKFNPHQTRTRQSVKKSFGIDFVTDYESDNINDNSSDEEPSIQKNKRLKVQSKINLDAERYANAIKESLYFVTCGICEYEGPRNSSVVIDANVNNRIGFSDLRKLYEAILHFYAFEDSLPSSEQKTSKLYREQFRSSLDKNGMLVNCKYLCKECYRQLPRKAPTTDYDHYEDQTEDDADSDEIDIANATNNLFRADASTSTGGKYEFEGQLFFGIPKFALTAGHFCGSIPFVLGDLTWIERSMISPINCISRISVHHKYAVSKDKVFSVMNDVAEIAKKLPRMPSSEEFAFVKSPGASSKSHKYRPAKIKAALIFLKQHNRKIYADIELDKSLWWWSDESLSNEYAIDIEFEEVSADDAEALEEVLQDNLAEVATNTGTSSDDEVFFAANNDIRNQYEHMREILGKPLLRSRGEYAYPTTTKNYWLMAFPCLFPFGIGCPTKYSNDSKYVKHCFERGGSRRFQKDNAFIFVRYNYEMQRKIGGISTVASRFYDVEANAENESATGAVENITAGDIRRVAEVVSGEEAASAQCNIKQIESILKRMTPYAGSVPGSSAFINLWRQNILTMINAPSVLERGDFRWFSTVACSDLYNSYIYAIAADEGNSMFVSEEFLLKDLDEQYEMRLKDVLSWNLERRKAFLYDHPALVCRVFDIQQDCILKFIIQGDDEPLGKVVDFFIRVEFQLRGTPHTHAMYCTENNSRSVPTAEQVHSEDESTRAFVEDYVHSKITAALAPRVAVANANTSDNYSFGFDYLTENEKEYILQSLLLEEKQDNFLPQPGFFNDANDPRRKPFSVSLKYDLSSTSDFEDQNTQTQYRNIQIACNMHKCTFTCWKYNPPYCKLCRFSFPRFDDLLQKAKIKEDRDRKNRVRVRVMPECNNVNLNPHIRSPLYTIAQSCNTDAQYISNKRGAAEYSACYSMKTEEPDSSKLVNFVSLYCNNKEIDTTSMKSKEHFKAVGYALLHATPVTTTQALWLLLKLKFVKCSRTIVPLNCLPRSKVTPVLLTDLDIVKKMDDQQSVICNGPMSQLGRRRCYSNFALSQQRMNSKGTCEVSYFSLNTCYRFDVYNDTKPCHRKLKELNSLIHTAPNSCIVHLDIGSFKIGEYVYMRYKKPVVIKQSPFRNIDFNDEDSCFAVLLLHMPWTTEESLVNNSSNAIQTLKAIMDVGALPSYVTPMLENVLHSQQVLESNCEPVKQAVEENCFSSSNDGCSVNDNPDNEYHSSASSSTYSDSGELHTNSGHPIEYTEGVFQIRCEDKNAMKLFVQAIQTEYIEHYKSFHQVNFGDMAMSSQSMNGESFYPYDDEKALLDQYEEGYESSSVEQKRSLDRIQSALKEDLFDNPNGQLIGFITGPGGTGKSYIIEHAKTIAKLKIGKTRGLFGPSVALAATGCAAHNIHGFTIAGALNYGFSNGDKICISDETAKSISAKFEGTSLIMIDEISLLGFEGIYKMHLYLSAARLRMETLSEETLHRNKSLSTLPFGGFNVLFLGDLYQLPPIGQKPVYSKPITPYAIEGKKLWDKINFFVELQRNFRFDDTDDNLLPLFLKGARTGDVDEDLLARLNKKCWHLTDHDSIMQRVHAKALWIAPTHAQVSQHNDTAMTRLKKNEAVIYRSIAVHVPLNHSVPLTDKTSEDLFKRQPDKSNKLQAADISYAVGQRVRVTTNLGTQVGIFNGAYGTIIGFGFSNIATDQTMHPPGPAYKAALRTDCEKPIIYVQMDSLPDDPRKLKSNKDAAEKGMEMPHAFTQYSCKKDTPRVIPFTLSESVTKIKSKGNLFHRWQYPLVPAHASTVHKVQGQTCSNGTVLDLPPKCKFKPLGLAYVALSRAKRAEHVVLLNRLYAEQFAIDPATKTEILNEYKRLKNSSC